MPPVLKMCQLATSEEYQNYHNTAKPNPEQQNHQTTTPLQADNPQPLNPKYLSIQYVFIKAGVLRRTVLQRRMKTNKQAPHGHLNPTVN